MVGNTCYLLSPVIILKKSFSVPDRKQEHFSLFNVFAFPTYYSIGDSAFLLFRLSSLVQAMAIHVYWRNVLSPLESVLQHRKLRYLFACKVIAVLKLKAVCT